MSSHGVADLLPNRLDDERWTFATALDIGGRAQPVRISESRPGYVLVEGTKSTLPVVRHMLRLDEDLSRFYALVADDAELAWVTQGAGRMLRSPTVFEDLVKTICTTNCTWAATVRMVTALVEHLGIGGRQRSRRRRSMAEASDDFYRDVARTGYRGAYLQNDRHRRRRRHARPRDPRRPQRPARR